MIRTIESRGGGWGCSVERGEQVGGLRPVERLCPVAIQPGVERELTEERSKKSIDCAVEQAICTAGEGLAAVEAQCSSS
jgi:hypothetical protein